MERLIANNMIYGGLLEITQAHLVNNYNAALGKLGLKPVAAAPFYIDAMGFSPQIAASLDDAHYLNPRQVNPRFILLTPKQQRLPFIQVSFSSTPDVMQAFFKANQTALDILTLKDTVFGEIEDDTYQVKSIQDLVSIRKVRFELHSVNGLLEAARDLQQRLEQFEREPHAWRNQELMEEIIALAGKAGDIRKNNPVPRALNFDKNDFWTDHFGGIFILRDGPQSVVVGAPERAPFPLDEKRALTRYMGLKDTQSLFSYLERSGRLEPLNRSWLMDSGILNQRIEQYLYAFIALAHKELAFNEFTPASLKRWLHSHGQGIEEDRTFQFFSRIKKHLRAHERIDVRRIPPDLRFLIHRARPDHPDAALINRLMAEYVPFDFIARFIFNKNAFYRDYATYPDNLRDYVAHIIQNTYFKDKGRYRQRMFGMNYRN